MPSFHPRAETIHTADCSVVLCRVQGPEATELYLHGRPAPGAIDAAGQAEAIYRALLGALDAARGDFASVVSETLFLRDVSTDLGAARAGRLRALAARSAPPHRPATTEIEQPPLDEGARVEVSMQAIVASGSPLRVDPIEAGTPCGCSHCAGTHGLRVRLGEETRLYAGALCGAGGSAHEQALAMFGAAEALLERAGMSFRDVVRTWIHLRDIDRDYDALNRARREFFAARGVAPLPASTGIGGGPAADAHALCLGLHAVRGSPPIEHRVMTAPTLNEASEYGADFARGMRITDANKIALHVSGTASVDAAGRTAHPGDIEAQVDRMLVNVGALLEGQGAGFADVVSAVTYLKRPADAARLRDRLREGGYEGFPNALVAAPICRPGLLCETEALAVLPRPAIHDPSEPA